MTQLPNETNLTTTMTVMSSTVYTVKVWGDMKTSYN